MLCSKNRNILLDNCDQLNTWVRWLKIEWNGCRNVVNVNYTDSDIWQKILKFKSGWPLRNVHISNDNGSFTFYVDNSFFYHCQEFCRTCLYIYMSDTTCVLKEAATAYPSWSPEFILGLMVGSVLLILCIFFVLYCNLCLRSEFRIVIFVTNVA